MKLTDRILNTLGLTSQAGAAGAAKRAYEQGFNDGGEDEPTSGTLRRYGYTQRTTFGTRDFDKLDYDTVVNTVWSVYQSNPVADRSINIKRDFILGRGVAYQIENDDLAEVIGQFRETNSFDRRLKDFIKQLFLFGVQCYPVFVREADGAVRLGYIDPQEIENVIAHPDNAMEIWAVVVKEATGLPAWAGHTRQRRVYRVIRPDEGFATDDGVVLPNYPDKLVTHSQAALEPWEQIFLAEFKLTEYTGSCFYERINAVSNQPRGYSDLLRVLDWLDQQDATLFSLADREQMAGYFFADVTLLGVSDEKVQARAAELRRNAPARGSVNVHNDQEQWSLEHPDLKQQPSVVTAEALFDHAWGGLGYPRHWYVQGDRTNRATAEEQAGPAERSLQSDQDDVALFILAILRFVRDQAEIAGLLNLPEEEREIEIQMPEISRRDMLGLSQSLSQLVVALITAQAEGLMTKENAIQTWAKVLAETGIDIDVQEIIDAADNGEMETAEAANRWLAFRLDEHSENS